MNAIVNIAVGATVESDGKRYTITHLLDLDTILAQEEGSEITARLYIKDLAPITTKHDDNETQTDLPSISDDDWREATRRLSIIQPLLRIRRTKEGVAEQARAAGLYQLGR